MKVLLAHPGTQHSAALARELDSRSLLSEYWTGIGLTDRGVLGACFRTASALGLGRRFGGRMVRGLQSGRLRCLPEYEFRALLAIRAGHPKLQTIHERNRAFQIAIPEESLVDCQGIIAFDTAAWILGERARRHGMPMCLDRTTTHPAHWQKVQFELHRRYPEWQPKPVPRPKLLIDAERLEHEIAWRIVVGGEFARETLEAEGVNPSRIRVNPYGVDWDRFGSTVSEHGKNDSRPFRYLFLGNIVARKGVPFLVDAWKQLGWKNNEAELWIAGPCGARERKLIPSLNGLRVLGKVPKSDVPKLFASCDVFVFPSLSEGFGMVLLEAIASGLPVITTRNTGGREIVRNPILGTLVEAGNVEELGEAIKKMRQSPPDRARVITEAKRMKTEFTWRAYGDRWAAMLKDLP